MATAESSRTAAEAEARPQARTALALIALLAASSAAKHTVSAHNFVASRAAFLAVTGNTGTQRRLSPASTAGCSERNWMTALTGLGRRRMDTAASSIAAPPSKASTRTTAAATDADTASAIDRLASVRSPRLTNDLTPGSTGAAGRSALFPRTEMAWSA